MFSQLPEEWKRFCSEFGNGGRALIILTHSGNVLLTWKHMTWNALASFGSRALVLMDKVVPALTKHEEKEKKGETYKGKFLYKDDITQSPMQKSPLTIMLILLLGSTTGLGRDHCANSLCALFVRALHARTRCNDAGVLRPLPWSR